MNLHDLAGESLDELQTRYNVLAVKRGIRPERMSAGEALEAIALGEAVAFHYRHPVMIHWAVKSGASWTAIAEARGVDEADARRDYGAWAHAQHRTGGMDTAAYRAALAAIKTGTLERSAGLVDRINGGTQLCTSTAASEGGGQWQCTLRPGHEGLHEAGGAIPLPVWEDDGLVAMRAE
jgi:hypothetical protein